MAAENNEPDSIYKYLGRLLKHIVRFICMRQPRSRRAAGHTRDKRNAQTKHATQPRRVPCSGLKFRVPPSRLSAHPMHSVSKQIRRERFFIRSRCVRSLFSFVFVFVFVVSSRRPTYLVFDTRGALDAISEQTRFTTRICCHVDRWMD